MLLSIEYFNPRSPHGERHDARLLFLVHDGISIHAPRTGSDSKARERIIDGEISIHAPRTGSDLMLSGYFYSHYNFNPRSPHGERRRSESKVSSNKHFNPRSPHGERLVMAWSWKTTRYFNPRSPHGERPVGHGGANRERDFNPRSPHGERRWVSRGTDEVGRFQSTLPARGATARVRRDSAKRQISIHAPRTGSDAP